MGQNVFAGHIRLIDGRLHLADGKLDTFQSVYRRHDAA